MPGGTDQAEAPAGEVPMTGHRRGIRVVAAKPDRCRACNRAIQQVILLRRSTDGQHLEPRSIAAEAIHWRGPDRCLIVHHNCDRSPG